STLRYECTTSSRCVRASAPATSATWGAPAIAADSLASAAVSSLRTTTYCPLTGFSPRCRLERSSPAKAVDIDRDRMVAAASAWTFKTAFHLQASSWSLPHD